MRKFAALIAAGLAVCLLTLWPSSQAHACSPIRCSPSVFLPLSGHVPSNAVEFLWQQPRAVDSTAPTGTPHLYKVLNGQRSEIPSEVVDGPDGFKRVRATQALPEGTELVLDSEEPACLSLAPDPARVTVSAASTKPTKLGTIQAGALEATSLNIPTNRGSCTADFNVAKVELSLALDASAQPFVDGMVHALIIDGERRPQRAVPPPGRFTLGLGGELEDVVYTLCGGHSDGWTRDLTPGSHRVQWLVTLPDGSELRSDEVEVALQCPAGAVAAADASSAGESSADAGAVPDAAASAPEATRERSEGDSADGEPEAEAHHAESSCALRASSGAPWSGAWLSLLALVFARRRRARRA